MIAKLLVPALIAAAAACAVAAIVVASTRRPPAGPPPAPPRSFLRIPASAAAPPRPARTPRRARPQAPVAVPVRVRIPVIGVDARLVPLGVDAAGRLEPPGRFDDAGWFARGARPGELGPAVIVGHVDSVSGPAVFYRVGALRPGASIRVERRDGTSIGFRVGRVERWPKTRFPTRRVYGASRGATLRLITCGGAFDAATGHYLDNTIVFARRG